MRRLLMYCKWLMAHVQHQGAEAHIYCYLQVLSWCEACCLSIFREGEIKDGINVHILLPPTVICNVMTKLSEDGKRSIEEIFFSFFFLRVKGFSLVLLEVSSSWKEVLPPHRHRVLAHWRPFCFNFAGSLPYNINPVCESPEEKLKLTGIWLKTEKYKSPWDSCWCELALHE